jgi:hypothetical protein
MNIKKFSVITIASMLILNPIFSDDFDFSEFEDEGSESSQSFDDLFGETSSSSSQSSELEISGTASTSLRSYLFSADWSDSDDYQGANLYSLANTSLSLDISHSAEKSDLTSTIILNEDTFSNPSDIIDELSYRFYDGDLIYQVGKTKIVWGRGDKLHVLDLINANDYTDFINEDYIDRRIGELEADVSWYKGGEFNINVQAVYTPFMTADRLTYSSDEIWTQSSILDANSLLEAYNVSVDLEDCLDDTDQLKYGQFGLRTTGTLNDLDFGLEYYYGHYKTPSVAATSAMSALIAAANAGLSSYLTADDISEYVTYDKLQVLGIDGEKIVGKFNLRGELAYYYTEDFEGDDSDVHNNSIQWVTGFSIDLPVNNMSLNVQDLGSYIINYDGSYTSLNVDYSAAEACSNMFVTQISYSFDHEKIKTSLSVIVDIEDLDVIEYIIKPSLDVTLSQGLNLGIEGSYFTGSDDSKFAAFNENGFIEVSCDYSF